MIGKSEILTLRDAVGNYSLPVLSLYVQTNPAMPNNHPHAVAARARVTMKRLGVPDDIVQTVSERLGAQVHQARTIVVFANASACETIGLEVDLPVVDERSGLVEARWGAPYITPLLLALDEYERYGVIWVDKERWRLFEVFLGQIAECEQAFRPRTARELDGMRSSSDGASPYLSDRGGATKDNDAFRQREAIRRFLDDAVTRSIQISEQRELWRWIIMGPDESVAAFQRLLPQAWAERVVARLPSLPRADISAQAVLDKVRPYVDAVEAEHEEQLLDRVREQGHFGVERCLRELQQGQLHVLLVPWENDRKVYVDPSTGFVSAEMPTLGSRAPLAHNGASRSEEKTLREVLPDLAVAFGARLEFLRGDRAVRLAGEFGGMAGLPRW